MKLIGFAFGMAACIWGLYAAYLWAMASGISPQFTGTEPGTEESSLMWQTSAIMQGGQASAMGNMRAAYWTGISAGLSGISALLGWFQ